MRTEDLTTKSQTLGVFLQSGSGRTITVICVASAGIRILVGRWTAVDFAVVAVSILLVGAVEWFLHLFLLHAPADSFRMRRLGTGTGHREHHLDPGHLGWALLTTADVALFSIMIAAGTAAWTLGLGLLWQSVFTGTGPLVDPVLTGIASAYLLLAHYEWTHLLIHTRYRPRTRYYRRLARNHRFHHYRNERYWLGITSNLGDRALGTYRTDRSSVPLSDTARNLN